MDLKTLLTSWYFIGLAMLVLAAVVAWPRSRQAVWKFLTDWSELLTLPTALVLWGYSDNLLRLLDPTAGTYDAGVFQLILFAILQLLALHGFVRLFMKLQWPTPDIHLDKYFAVDFESLTPPQRICVSLSVFFGLLFALILLSRVI
jgi:hypothetical protein